MLDFTQAMRGLMADVVRHCPELSHIRLEQVLIGLSRARKDEATGQFAKICPLRFEGGRDWVIHRKRKFVMPKLVYQGHEILYIIYFCMPKFLQSLKTEDKLLTVFHELYHISPRFDGDIRRFPGRKFAHGHSRDAYNEQVRRLVEAYLSNGGSRDAWRFLEHSFEDLEREHQGIVGLKVRQPRPLLADTRATEPSRR